MKCSLTYTGPSSSFIGRRDTRSTWQKVVDPVVHAGQRRSRRCGQLWQPPTPITASVTCRCPDLDLDERGGPRDLFTEILPPSFELGKVGSGLGIGRDGERNDVARRDGPGRRASQQVREARNLLRLAVETVCRRSRRYDCVGHRVDVRRQVHVVAGRLNVLRRPLQIDDQVVLVVLATVVGREGFLKEPVIFGFRSCCLQDSLR